MLNGPDIRKLIKDVRFDKVLDDEKLRAWQAVKEVIKGFLGKKEQKTTKK